MKKILLVLIIALAFAFRFWNLDNFPALNADEAAIGYNAYSLILTGKDEHGNSWPIHFQSFNDYKPGLYFYLVLPFVRALGLNEWAVRIPNATLGVLTVLAVYLLVKEQFKKEKFALLSAFLLAISPWHIHFSRGGWEANTATFFITAGLWLFLKSANNKFKINYLILSALSLIASIYAYHSARVIIPLLGIGLLIKYWKNMKGSIKNVLIVGLLGIVLLIPLVLDLKKGEVSSRAAGVGLFADPGPRSRVEEQRGEHGNYLNIIAKAPHNKIVNYSLAFFKNLTYHYSLDFLFLSGDIIQRNKVPETGQLYLIEALFVLVGVVAVIKKSTGWSIIFWWLLVAPTAAALTFQAPHALRAENMVVPLEIVSAYGLYTIFEWLTSKKFKLLGYAFLAAAIVLSFAMYEHMYWIHMAKEYPYSSQYGVKELVSYVGQNQDKYKKILTTDRYDQPYILFLFYMKYDPAKFQKEHVLTPRDGFGFSTVNHFDKYYFASIKYDQARPENPNTLIVGTDGEIPNEANVVKNIYGSNDYLYFQAVAN